MFFVGLPWQLQRMGLRQPGLCCQTLLVNKITWWVKFLSTLILTLGSELTIQSSVLLIEDRKALPDKWSEVNQDNLIFTYCTIRWCLVPTGKLAWLRLCKPPCCFISSNANGEWGTTCTPCTPSKAVLGFTGLWVPICNWAISQLNMTDCQH